jgi:lipopolysaccharide transport system ATP-binding protein
MRLAFAVAAHLNPEILLIDEVLAVGDTAFQKKCLSRMNDVAKEGRTILFVSHNLIAVESLCTRAILLSKGRVRAVGPTHSIVSQYLSQSDSSANMDLSQKHRRGTGELRFTAVKIGLPGGEPGGIRAGDDIEITLDYVSHEKILRPTFSISIHSAMAVPIFCINTTDLNYEIDRIDRDGTIKLNITRANLMPGRYLVHIAAGDSVHATRYDHIVDAAEFEIQLADVYGSGRLDAASWTTVFLDCQWQVCEVAGVGHRS